MRADAAISQRYLCIDTTNRYILTPTATAKKAELESTNLTMPAFHRPTRAKRAANHRHKKLAILDTDGFAERNLFEERLRTEQINLYRTPVEILQINVGKMCNLTCHHCHVEAGPDRTEIMTAEHMDQLVKVAEKLNVRTVDLTGGAPEMWPGFPDAVHRFRALGCEVIVRSNLTILVDPEYTEYVDLFAKERVRVVASLPCYTADNVDQQRGDGVFQDSIKALQALNRMGYGTPHSGLILDLVYNPLGASLPGPQEALEQAYKQALQNDFGLQFNSLLVITNMPIGRFYSDLKKAGKADDYDTLLQTSFNGATVRHLMCRTTP